MNYNHKETLHHWTILGVDVVIKELQYPDNSTMCFDTTFHLGNEKHMLRYNTLESIRGAVKIIIANYINQRSS